MKKINQIKKAWLYAGIFLLVMGFPSCSDDDDINDIVDVTAGLPTGYIWIDDFQSLTGNI